jgi:4-hydroxy-tetrahydrodipicolinate reductase
MKRIRVLVAGAAGRMGREVVRAVCGQEDMELVGAVDQAQVGEEAARVAGLDVRSVSIVSSLSEAIAECKPDVAVDFTVPSAVKANVTTCLKARVACVVGATGLAPADLEEIARRCQEHNTPALVAPNFAIGAVLMMQFAAQAARHFDAAEIIELHHSGKVDAPSGTARRTAKMIAEAGCRAGVPTPADSPARGQREAGIHIHSVRLPGLVAHQEVIFGGLGQTLTIRHDSTSRESFMPGVLLAIRKVRELSGLVVGLEGVM